MQQQDTPPGPAVTHEALETRLSRRVQLTWWALLFYVLLAVYLPPWVPPAAAAQLAPEGSGASCLWRAAYDPLGRRIATALFKRPRQAPPERPPSPPPAPPSIPRWSSLNWPWRPPPCGPPTSTVPDASVSALSYRGDTTALLGKARLEGVAGVITNFYDPMDLALGLGAWIALQTGVPIVGKPIGSYQYETWGTHEIQWDPAGNVNRKVTDPHEAMAMVNISWSGALGRAATRGGKIPPGNNINMNGPGMGFDEEHEAAFKWHCAKTWVFYGKLWTALDLPAPMAP